MRPHRLHTARISADVASCPLRSITSDGVENRRLDNFGRLFRSLVAALLALTVAGCGSPSAEASKAPPAELASVTSAEEKPQSSVAKADNSQETKATETVGNRAAECPVTIPPEPGLEVSAPDDVVYTEAFPAPEPYPRRYPRDGMVWYGTEDLWTALPVDGEYEVRKSVWWSTNFPGGTVEEQPEVWVTWTRLVTDEPVVVDNDGRATNAHTAEEGWFMIAGIDPDQPGCWKVEAAYEDSTLSYVYHRS